MKDAAILTKFYKNYNYGGMLQGFALRKAVREMGYSVDLISYDVGANPNPVYPGLRQQIRQYGALSAVNKAAEKAIGKCDFLIEDLLAARKEKFDLFMEKAGIGSELYDDESSATLCEKYKAFISGSDQIWNPNAVRNLYLQTFAEDPKRKISYAASIGREVLSRREASVLIPAIRGFGSLSVRENTARELLAKYIDGPIEVSLDPTMLLDPEEWSSAAAENPVAGRYALVYFFSDSLKVRRKAEKFCAQQGLKMIMIPYAKQEYNLTDAAGPGERLMNVGPEDFVALIRDAEFVLTDSFHGAAFSILYKRPFAVFERNRSGHVSMNSRLYDLLGLFGQQHRLCKEADIVRLEELTEIDEEQIERILRAERQKAKAYLRRSLDAAIRAAEEDRSPCTVRGDEENCTGCGACVSVCPAGCIELLTDRNGFEVPVIDENRCIRCGECRKVCPIQGEKRESNAPVRCFGAYAKKEVSASTSGGVGGALMRRWTKEGGVVYGSAYGKDLRVTVTRVTDPKEVDQLRGSKYVQSHVGDSVSLVLRDLAEGRRVLFTGTPCQIAGVRAAAAEKCPDSAENLYTAEIICHGVPSPGMFRSYLYWLWERYSKKVSDYGFRSKNNDTDQDFMVSIGFEDGSSVRTSGFKDPYYRLFLSSGWFRKSCYVCPFAGKERAADITLGDFWNTGKLPAGFGADRRVSVLLINTEKGERLLNSVKEDLALTEIPWETAAEGNANLVRPTKRPEIYTEFGDITDTGVFFDREASGKVDYKKYWFNRLPHGWRRNVKGGLERFANLRKNL